MTGLYQEAQTGATSLDRKLMDLTEEEWDELTRRLKAHFEKAMEQHGYVMVKESRYQYLLGLID